MLVVGDGAQANALFERLSEHGLEPHRCSTQDVSTMAQAVAADLVVVVDDTATHAGESVVAALGAERATAKLPVLILGDTTSTTARLEPAQQHVGRLPWAADVAASVLAITALLAKLEAGEHARQPLQHLLGPLKAHGASPRRIKLTTLHGVAPGVLSLPPSPVGLAPGVLPLPPSPVGFAPGVRNSVPAPRPSFRPSAVPGTPPDPPDASDRSTFPPATTASDLLARTRRTPPPPSAAEDQTPTARPLGYDAQRSLPPPRAPTPVAWTVENSDEIEVVFSSHPAPPDAAPGASASDTFATAPRQRLRSSRAHLRYASGAAIACVIAWAGFALRGSSNVAPTAPVSRKPVAEAPLIPTQAAAFTPPSLSVPDPPVAEQAAARAEPNAALDDHAPAAPASLPGCPLPGAPTDTVATELEQTRIAPHRPSRAQVAAATHQVSRGHTLLEHHRLQSASDSYLRALEHVPGDPRALAGLARVCIALGDGAGAARWAERAVAQKANSGSYQLLLGDALALSGDADQASVAWERAARFGNRVARQRSATHGNDTKARPLTQ